MRTRACSRLAIAELAAGSAAAARRYAAALRERFAENERLGNNVHLRERARFELEVANDPAAALARAGANWAVQREAVDAGLLLTAALAADQPGAARPVRAWMTENRIEDPRLVGLADAARVRDEAR